MSSKRVYWIEGDGIGPEIWRAARPVIDAALAKESDMRIEWVELLAGEKATAETGSPLPEETMNALRTADFAMKGPLGTPVGTGIRSLNVALRQTLDLYALHPSRASLRRPGNAGQASRAREHGHLPREHRRRVRGHRIRRPDPGSQEAHRSPA